MGKNMFSKNKLAFFIYDEITLFFVNLIVVILFLFDEKAKSAILKSFISPEASIFFPIMFAGFLSVFYLIFSEKESRICKSLSGFYIALVSFFVGLAVSYNLKEGDVNSTIRIISIINILLPLALLIAMRIEYINPEDLVSNRQAKRRELVLGIILVPALFVVSEFYMKNHWTETFSICLFYTIFINNLSAKFLPDFGNSTSSKSSKSMQRSELFKALLPAILFIVFLVGLHLRDEYAQLEEERINSRLNGEISFVFCK